jgi:protein-tyrosine kinase
VTPNAPRTFMADQYRVIKRPLITNAMGKGATRQVDTAT